MAVTSRLFILTALFALGACNSSHLAKQAGVGDNTTNEKAVLAPKSAINWPLMRDAILNDCKDCHAKMKTYDGISAKLEKIVKKVGAKEMPPIDEGYMPLSDCQIAILKTWVAMGAPPRSPIMVNTVAECAALVDPDAPKPDPQPAPTPQPVPQPVPEPTPTPQPTPGPAPQPTPGPAPNPAPMPRPNPGGISAMPLTYATLKREILDAKCVKCHNAASPSDASETLFVPYSEITNRPDLWKAPGAASLVIRALTRTDNKRMPPPPRNAALSADEIDFVTRWIDAGMPE